MVDPVNVRVPAIAFVVVLIKLIVKFVVAGRLVIDG